jgi:hypothetical protein
MKRRAGSIPLPPGLTDPYVSSYVYVGNSPTVLGDPSGLCAMRALGTRRSFASGASPMTSRSLAGFANPTILVHPINQTMLARPIIGGWLSVSDDDDEDDECAPYRTVCGGTEIIGDVVLGGRLIWYRGSPL